jgi:1-acyl-sn-glycerol-3-phosphate acyltransferase
MRTLGFFVLYKGIMRFFLSLIVGVKWINIHHLKAKGPYILVSNHNSHLDTMALLSALPAMQIRTTHPVAAMDYFGKSRIKKNLTRFLTNAILIQRTRTEGSQSPTERLLTFLDKNHSIILFPEGSRGEPEQLQRFQKGIGALLYRRPEIPYIPIYMSGMGRVLPKGEKILIPFESYVMVGEPRKVKAQGVEEIVAEVTAAVRSLEEALKEAVGTPSGE